MRMPIMDTMDCASLAAYNSVKHSNCRSTEHSLPVYINCQNKRYLLNWRMLSWWLAVQCMWL